MSKYVPLLCAVWNRPEKYEWQNEWKGKWRATYAALKWAACAFAGRSEEWPGHTSCPSYRDDVYEYAPQSTARKSKQICRRMCLEKPACTRARCGCGRHGGQMFGGGPLNPTRTPDFGRLSKNTLAQIWRKDTAKPLESERRKHY